MANTGFDVRVSYIVPVSPGMTATKEKVTIASGIPKENVKAAVMQIHNMMADIAAAFEGMPPSWSPFVYGTTVVPTGWGL